MDHSWTLGGLKKECGESITCLVMCVVISNMFSNVCCYKFKTKIGHKERMWRKHNMFSNVCCYKFKTKIGHSL